jgi:lipopolysaccharide export system permease protein
MRPRLSPTMDRFIGGQFFGPFLVCLTAFTIAYLLGDMFDRFNDLIRYGGFGLLGLEYFALKIPLIVSQLLPVACLAGVLLGFALLNRSGEVLACQQLGISRLEMATPVLALAVLISVFNFILNETVVPITTREARYLYEVELKKREIKGLFGAQQIWVRVANGFLSAAHYDARAKTLREVTLYRIGPDYRLRDIELQAADRWTGGAGRTDGPVRSIAQTGGLEPAQARAGRIQPMGTGTLYRRPAPQGAGPGWLYRRSRSQVRDAAGVPDHGRPGYLLEP